MFQRDYEMRDAAVVGGDGRTVVLACVPFDTPATVDDGAGPYVELFRRGAFSKITKTSATVELQMGHQKTVPFGFGIEELREEPSYLVGAFRVAPSERGDQLLALINDNQLRGVSIGYVAGAHPGDNRETLTRDGRLVERLHVRRLVEVSLTPAPAYVGAEVLAVREQFSPDPTAADIERRRARAEWDLYKLRNVR